jgi:DNA-binding PadR family transcriptional regulator
LFSGLKRFNAGAAKTVKDAVVVSEVAPPVIVPALAKLNKNNAITGRKQYSLFLRS